MAELSEEVADDVGRKDLEEHDLAHQIEVQCRGVPLAVVWLTSEVSHLCPDENDHIKDAKGHNQIRTAEALFERAECHCTEKSANDVESKQTPEHDSDATTV